MRLFLKMTDWPFIFQDDSHDTIVYNSYYQVNHFNNQPFYFYILFDDLKSLSNNLFFRFQWVPLYLIFLSVLFYMPRCFWLMMEGGLMKFFGKGTTTRLSSSPSLSPSSSPSSSPSLPSSSSLIIMKLRQTSNHYHINNRTIYTIIINNRIICITISTEVSTLIVFIIVCLIIFGKESTRSWAIVIFCVNTKFCHFRTHS